MKRLLGGLLQETLALEDLNAVHQLTYTLEVALEKLHTELAARCMWPPRPAMPRVSRSLESVA